MASNSSVLPRPVEIRLSQFAFVVRPMPLRVWAAVGEGPDVVFRNDTSLDVRVVFEDDGLAAKKSNGKPVRSFRVAAHQVSPVLTFNTKRFGRHEYRVLVTLPTDRGKVRLEAMGGSRPEVEIVR